MSDDLRLPAEESEDEVPTTPDPVGLALAGRSVTAVADLVAALALSTITGTVGANVILPVDRGARVVLAGTAGPPAIRDLGVVEAGDDDHPAAEVADTGVEARVRFPDERHPALSASAEAAGVGVLWCLPLVVDEALTGTLALCAADDQAWSERAGRAARSLADQAAIVLANAASLANLERTNVNLRLALDSRDVIGQAKGVLRARHGLSDQEAFELLRETSQNTNRKLFDVAVDVLATLPAFDLPADPGVDVE